MNRCLPALSKALLALVIATAPAVAHAASVGLGATVMCAWWDSAAQSSIGGIGAAKDTQIPDAAGGPFLNAQINDTWGLQFSYTYGKFTWDTTSAIIGVKSVEQRHDVDVIVSAAVHRYVKLFFGGKYWNTMSDLTTKVLFLSYGSKAVYHRGGPGVGVGLSLPLGAGFYLLPNVSAVFMFGNVSLSNGDPISATIDKLVKASGNESTSMYYGINSTLTLAYNFEKVNLTLALGGRLQYLWIYFIEAEQQGNGHDMYGGITFSAMYTFDIPGNGAGKK
jgi:hypothetical protein